MVWVRYGFGILMIALALYYLANSGKLGPAALFCTGFGLAVLSAIGITRHLVRKEGEATGPAATRGAKVAILLVLATGLVAALTRPPSASGAGTAPLTWATVKSREALVAEVAKARREGKATVVDVWAEWCTYCKKYDRDIEANASVKAGFQRLHRVRIDLTDEDRPWEEGLREGLDIPGNTQPYMVFIDAEGRIRRGLDVEEYLHEKTPRELESRIEAVHKAP
jgi:thioredoxin:protein disulfide reductase